MRAIASSPFFEAGDRGEELKYRKERLSPSRSAMSRVRYDWPSLGKLRLLDRKLWSVSTISNASGWRYGSGLNRALPEDAILDIDNESNSLPRLRRREVRVALNNLPIDDPKRDMSRKRQERTLPLHAAARLLPKPNQKLVLDPTKKSLDRASFTRKKNSPQNPHLQRQL